MRRVAILITLIALDIWLIGGSARNGQAVIPGLASTVSAQTGCCPPGTGDYPHWGCNYAGQCEWLMECGFNDCSACEGCDPADEQYCLDIGWDWDPETCTCNPPHCNPAERDECIWAGCFWEDVSCTCTCPPPPCNPGPPVLVGWDSVSSSYCIGCYLAEVCTTEVYYYVQYCRDGTYYDSWTEQYSYCAVGFEWYCDLWCLIE
jgi:hypothetical protein